MPHDDFWSFANRLYRQPGVAPACLWLQDNRGADVMLVLFCLWRGLRQGPQSGEAVAALDGAVAPWRDQVVRPLRGARRWLKEQTDADGDGLRAAIAAAELRAEQAQGRLLVNALEAPPLPAAPPGIDAARANLEHYRTLIAAPGADRELSARLQWLLDSAAQGGE